MAPHPHPQPTRFAIQKARGKGWKTLEVGEDLDHARARFELMVRVNPRAYFRLIQLDHNAGADFEGLEFNWTLIELYDPTRKAGKGGRVKPAPKPARAATRRAAEKVPLPLRFYVTVILIGSLIGVLLYVRFGAPPH
ncbi:hypothetical protein [Azospirillum canadense]|uniref:hypothetical protein n=1 Tax=Azospirillum canadense TaxID=403962 RepID=UPI002227D8B7|nr:hypothetical protein [Azospirillum canadense]MCW2242751.1 hypothetical protein [Azospirillum canadense]